MSLKGGYKIIDLKGVDVTQNTMMIEGIYESIESNYGKPLLISGILINGVEKDDVFVQATLNGTAYEFELYGHTIQVQDTDAVGVKNIIRLVTPTEDIDINLKNGDFYFLNGISNYEYTYTFKKSSIKGLVVNATGFNLTNLEDIFSSYSIMNQVDDHIMCYFALSNSGSVEQAMIYVNNDIIYITLPYEL